MRTKLQNPPALGSKNEVGEERKAAVCAFNKQEREKSTTSQINVVKPQNFNS